MKKPISIYLLLVLTIVLSACGVGSADQDIAEATAVNTGSDGSVSYPYNEDQIPANQLVVGTLQLEETELAVTSDQAQTLLTLWKAYRSLLESDTAAQAELQAVLNQIQSTMMVQQIEAIRDMEITQEEIADLVEELDLLPDDLPEDVADGNFLGGGPGTGRSSEGGFGGGQGPSFESEISPEQMATAQAMREERGGFGNRMGSFLVNPLIEYLEGKDNP